MAYSLIDELPEADHVEDRLAVRASSLELVVRSATGPIDTGSPDCPRKIPLPLTT